MRELLERLEESFESGMAIPRGLRCVSMSRKKLHGLIGKARLVLVFDKKKLVKLEKGDAKLLVGPDGFFADWRSGQGVLVLASPNEVKMYERMA